MSFEVVPQRQIDLDNGLELQLLSEDSLRRTSFTDPSGTM